MSRRDALTPPDIFIFPANLPASARLTDRRQVELDRAAGVAPRRRTAVPLRLLADCLLDAARNNRTWLSDFADEPVLVDSDVHEILLASQRHRRAA